MKILCTGVILYLCVVSSLAWWEDPKPEDDNEMGDLDESMQDLAEPNARKLLH